MTYSYLENATNDIKPTMFPGTPQNVYRLSAEAQTTYFNLIKYISAIHNAINYFKSTYVRNSLRRNAKLTSNRSALNELFHLDSIEYLTDSSRNLMI